MSPGNTADALRVRCPECGALGSVPVAAVDDWLAADDPSVPCGACGHAYPAGRGVVQIRPAPPEWGYTKWNKIQKVSEEAWTGDWQTAAKSSPWLTWAGRAMPLMACGIPEGGRVLDVGSGPGAMLIGLASAGYDMTGLDASEPLLRFCAARAHQQGLGDRVRLVCSDFASFHAPDAAFDAVVMNGFLEWLPEFMPNDPRRPVDIQAAAVATAAKWVKPGGCVIIGLENRFGLKYWLGGMDDHTNQRFTSVLPRWISGWMYRRKHGKPFRCHTPSLGDLKRWAHGAGLEMESVLSPLPTYREPRACIRADDVDGGLEVMRVNAGWVGAAPLRHRVMARAAALSSPLIRVFPGLGRFFTNYFFAVMRVPGATPARSPEGLDFSGSSPTRLLRNQHIATFSSGETIVRMSLAEPRAAEEARWQSLAAESLPESLRHHINAPTAVREFRGVFGAASYRRLMAKPCTHAQLRAQLPSIEKLLRGLAGVSVPGASPLCGTLRSLYVLGHEGDAPLVADLTERLAPHLPLDRLTHGDLFPGNLVNTDRGLVLVDWESAGAGHPWLDWLRINLSPLAAPAPDIPATVSAISRFMSSDPWTRELFPSGAPPDALMVAAAYVLVSKDFSGLKALRKAGTPAIGALASACKATSPR